MRSRGLSLVLVFVGFAAGCSSTQQSTFQPGDLPATFPDHSAEQVLKLVALGADTLESVTTKTRIRFETPERNGSANLNIRYRSNDSLAASIRVTLGLEGAKALITPDSFFVYERISKKLYHGEAEMIKAFFPTPAPLDELFPSLTGTLVPDPLSIWRVSADSLYYHLVSDDGRISYTVDPRIWRVVEYAYRSTAGTLEESRTFSDFDWFGSTLIPRRIEAERPGDFRRVWVYHRDVEVNPADLSLDFDIGDPSEKILVRPRYQ